MRQGKLFLPLALLVLMACASKLWLLSHVHPSKELQLAFCIVLNQQIPALTSTCSSEEEKEHTDRPQQQRQSQQVKATSGKGVQKKQQKKSSKGGKQQKGVQMYLNQPLVMLRSW